MIARSESSLQAAASQVEGDVLPVQADITDPDQVASAFKQVRDSFGPVDILINHASFAAWKGLLELSPEEFEQSWRVTVFGGFLCAKEAVSDMLKSGDGAILFTGATSGIRGRAGALAFSSAKFGVRGMADSLAREYWPQGIHVAHIVIDGIIDTPQVRERYNPDENEPLLNPDAIADSYWSLTRQDRSAWTFELEVRPHDEEFFS
jgi:NAD(P)-dependent dehydrogenase (short-subunit alcohol dehydrogenase family)